VRRYVRNQWGVPLPCCWDECELPGLEEVKAVSTERRGPPLTYIFCSDRHKLYWLFSPRGNGMLPSGDRRLWVPPIRR
jgi:hypothetical protein